MYLQASRAGRDVVPAHPYHNILLGGASCNIIAVTNINSKKSPKRRQHGNWFVYPKGSGRFGP